MTVELAKKMKLENNYIQGLIAGLIILFNSTVFAAGGININASNGLAIHGFDPVAYFVDSKAAEGKPEFIVEYQGNKWAFSNQQNKQAFLKEPNDYIPQYGGHCAFAASKNALANTDPYAWTVHNKKLYLNYSKGVRDTWKSDRDANIIQADIYWPELSKRVKEKEY